MQSWHLGPLFLLVLPLVACGEPTIDTSTDEAMEASIERIREDLSTAERDSFDAALQVIALSDVTLEGLLAESEVPGATGAAERVKERLSGKSASDVFAMRDSILAEREARQREQALAEIEELRAKRETARVAREALDSFEVLRSRFYVDRSGYMRQPIIDITVKNGTDQAISRAYFAGTVASPGRSVPWIQEDFNYRIPGGLEPSEEARWRLEANIFGGWATEVPADAVLTAEVVKLDGADGETLWEADFDEDDAERLEALESEYGTD